MIEVQNLHFSYTGTGPYVLRGLNLTIKDGEYVSVVGSNGSGKTTLMRLLLGFLRPTGGTVTVHAARAGYVPQRREAPGGFPITVFESLNAYRRLLGIRDKSVIGQVLASVGFPGKEGALMDTLSGGQSQKVLIARALLGSPDLLILDEPSSGVDPESQRDIYTLLKELNRQKGITVVSVEHNIDAAVKNSTGIYHLVDGHGHLCSPRQYADEFLRGEE